MIIGRYLSYIILFAALLALGAEILVGLEQGGWEIQAAGQVWYNVDPASLNVSQAVIQRYLHPALWDNVMLPLLELPAWFVLGMLGGLLWLVFRRRKPRRRFSSS